MPLVEEEWKNMKIEGREDFFLKEKLRLFKEKLRRWNMKVFGRIDLELEEGVRDLNLADVFLEREDGDLFSETLDRRKEASNRIWRNMRIKENMLLKKYRVKWMKERDANSNFFHKVVKEKISLNHIGPILVEGHMEVEVEEVREAVFNHFGKKFVEVDERRPLLDGIHFNRIKREDMVDIEKPFKESEIREAIWSCRGDKSLGPDGYTFLFFMKCWSIIKETFVNFFEYFYSGNVLSK